MSLTTLKYSCNGLLPGHLVISLPLWYKCDFLCTMNTLAKDVGI